MCSIDNTSAIIAPFVRMTPFGSPVVPLVYIIVQTLVFWYVGNSQFKVPCNWSRQYQIEGSVKITVRQKGTFIYTENSLDRRRTNLENSSQEKQDTPNSSASCFCALEIFAKLTIAEQGKCIISSP